LVPADLDSAYSALDLPPGAPPEEIKTAYVDLVKVWHPDRFQHECDRLRQRAELKLKTINEAYGKLRLRGMVPAAKYLTLTPVDFGGNWGYVDEGGAPVIYPGFAAARPFAEGLAAAKLVEKWGFIDMDGDFVMNPVYDECGDFSEGVASVKWYGRWGYVDRQGRFAIQPRYQAAKPFRNGWGEVQLGLRWGRVNLAGDVVFTEQSTGRQIS
jgi:hypothetical protein